MTAILVVLFIGFLVIAMACVEDAR